VTRLHLSRLRCSTVWLTAFAKASARLAGALRAQAKAGSHD
jgi:hypothetical protein